MVTLTVLPQIVRTMRRGQPIPPAIVLRPGRRRPWEPCYSAALTGPVAVIYDPEGTAGNGRSLYLVAPTAEPISAAAGAAILAHQEAQGRPTFIHANIHRARANAAGASPRQPIIAIRHGRYGRPTYAMRVRVDGPCWLVACPDRMLPCSAKVFLIVPPGTAVAAAPS